MDEVMATTFGVLRSVLKKHAGKLIVTKDTPRLYYVDAGFSETWQKEVFFGAVRLGKSYVSYHLIPVYTCPELVKDLSPELRKRMQGKSCFNFKSISTSQLKELDSLTGACVRRFKQVAKLRRSPR
jgi:hypothetical protein